jgi:hypothetical protein
VDTATTLRSATTGIAADVLEKFRVNYSETKLTKLGRVFIACFSSMRNSDAQWREYADGSRGLCLGIPVLNGAGPSDHGLIRFLAPVDYLESSWRARTRKVFEQIRSEVAAATPGDQATSLRIQRSALNALFRIAAYAAVTAKQPRWSHEQEWRQIIFAPNTVSIEVRQRESPSRRYLALFMWAGEKHIALTEVLIGSNQDATWAEEKLTGLLRQAGYPNDFAAMPKILHASSLTSTRP